MADRGERRRGGGDEIIDWFTVTYKSIFSVVGVVFLLVGIAGYYYFGFHLGGAPTSVSEDLSQVGAATRFTSLEGSVRVKEVGKFEWLAVTNTTVLRKGDLVRTGSGATAEITFGDGTVMQIRPDSLLTIEATGQDRRRRDVAVKVPSGGVSYNKPSSVGSARFTTPTAKVTQGGAGAGDVAVAESGETDVRVFKGEGTVETRAGELIPLTANQGLRVDSKGRPGQKVTLPGIPVLLVPSHRAEIAYPNPARATTLLAWREVPMTTAYHVMLDYSAYFNRPLVDQKVRDTSVALRGLDAGKYYWRVAAVGKGSAEGSFSSFSRFSVVRASANRETRNVPPPPLVVHALDVRTNILHVKGKTEAGATVKVNDQRIDVNSDGSFNEFVTLDRVGQQVVIIRSVGLNGGVAERRRTVIVAAD